MNKHEVWRAHSVLLINLCDEISSAISIS